MLDQMLSHTFMQYALVGGLLACVACGVVGSLVVVRRVVFLAGGVSHAAFGGIGLAIWFAAAQGIALSVLPIYVAIAFALATAGILAYASARGTERLDTLIGVLWAVGMAIGVLFVHLAGYSRDMGSYLFGSILLVSAHDVWMLLVLDVLAVGTVILGYRGFVALLFDEEYTAVVGAPARRLNLAMLMLMAVTVVVLIKFVGIILVMALLTIPASIAGRLTRTLHGMMITATGISVVFVIGGIVVAFYADLHVGATIVLSLAAAYTLVLAGQRLLPRLRRTAPPVGV